MEFSKIPIVFFEALEYPDFARPNFYINRQRESHWAKGVFLTALNEVYHVCVQRIEFDYRFRKRKEPELKLDEIELPIKDVTGEKTLRKVTKETLDDLHKAVWAAQYFDQPSKSYTLYQILSFTEYALWFIRNEFQEQAKVSKNRNPRPRTPSYFHYLISQDAPFFDFPKFKNAFRELNFTIQNRAPFEKIAGNFHKAAKEIVSLWNNHIYKLISTPNAHEVSEIVRVEFKGEELTHSRWNDTGLFETKPHSMYLNQDLAQYAARIANVIADEVPNKKHVSIQLEERVFLNDFISACHVMLEEEPKLDLRKGERKEDVFRTWVWRWFRQLKYAVEREPLKGTGFIDLKVHTKDEGLKIIEFKGWWNPKRKTIVQQTCNYLTDFEGDAYIFMINHTKNNIERQYREIVEDQTTGYIKNTWTSHKVSSFVYFKSEHQHGAKKKILYHFIYNV
jgi:hypothetical protein